MNPLNPTRRFIALAAAAIALGTLGLTQAQAQEATTATPAGPGASQPRGMGPGMGPGNDHRMHGGRHGGPRGPITAAELDTHLAKLKTDLKITAAQEGAWKQFEDSARAQHKAREATRKEMQDRRAAGTRPDANERQALREKMQKQMEADRAERMKARDALYAALSPEQKTLADKHMRPGRGMRHDGPGHRGGPRGDGPGAKPQAAG